MFVETLDETRVIQFPDEADIDQFAVIRPWGQTSGNWLMDCNLGFKDYDFDIGENCSAG